VSGREEKRRAGDVPLAPILRVAARMRRDVTGFASAMPGQAKPLVVSDPPEPIFRYLRDYAITAPALYRVT
jgi:hypothetical protein